MSTNIGLLAESNPIGPIIYGPTPPEVSNVSISDATPFIVGGELRINQYTYFDVNGDLESGSTLNWYSGATDTGPWNLVQTNLVTASTAWMQYYIIQPTDVYVRIGIVPATAIAPEWGIEVFSEPVQMIEPEAPYATELNILSTNEDGTVYVGTTLSGIYKYNDVNLDPENATIIKWYTSDTLSGPWTEVHQETTSYLSGGNYTITDSDYNKYIRMGVTPRNNNNPIIGTEVFYILEKLIKYIPTAPIINNLRLERIVKETTLSTYTELNVGDTLIIKYDYVDLNGRFEGNSEYRWYKARYNNPSDPGTLIRNINGAPYSNRTYIITEEDRGYEIFAEVIPKTL